MNSGLKQFHLHLVSDATGETINSVARACVAQFDQVQPTAEDEPVASEVNG